MSLPKPPKGFTSLDRAGSTVNKPFDLIGVCVDHFDPTKSRGTDYTCQFVLHDPSWNVDRGMKFRFFNSSIERLPQIQANGDIVILRNVMTKEYNLQRLGMSNSATSWVVLSGSSVVDSTQNDGSDITFVVSSKGLDRAPAPTIEELKYAKEIASLEDPLNYRRPPKSTSLQIENNIKEAGGTPSRPIDKRQLIRDLTPDARAGKYNFADIFGEVRKSWYNDYGRVELSLTDYTTNKLLYSYDQQSSSQDGDAYGYLNNKHEHWPGPWGRMVLNVLLHDIHAEYAKSQVKPGMYVLIRNCHVKLDPKGSKLEAVCRGDREDPSKINVSIFKPSQADGSERFKELLQRRLEYEKFAKAKGLRFGFGKANEDKDNKRALEDSEVPETTNETTTENPRKETKASRKRRKKALENKKEQPSITTTASDVKDKLSATTNQHVRCENINIPITPLSTLLDLDTLHRKTPNNNPYTLPFQNSSYKLKVRVTDYWPHNLANFSVPYLLTDHDDAASDTDDPTSQPLDSTFASARANPHTVRWEWRFFLVVEDASPGAAKNADGSRPRMAILVADMDGDYLLNQEATDLHASAQELAKLREKMFFIWGGLQERKEEEAARASGGGDGPPASDRELARPFECFVKEYGVPLPSRESNKGVRPSIDSEDDIGYQRMFRMFGTSI